MPSMLRAPSGVGRGRKVQCFLSISLWNGGVCANDFAIKAFEYGNAFDIFG